MRSEWNRFYNYYLENTWVKSDALFPPAAWNLSNKRKEDLMNRTNNSLEGYNNRLNNIVMEGKLYPNLSYFVTRLSSESVDQVARIARIGNLY